VQCEDVGYRWKYDNVLKVKGSNSLGSLWNFKCDPISALFQ
jgi:hypothetical protein